MRADTEDSGLVSQLKVNAIWLLPLLAIIWFACPVAAVTFDLHFPSG
ncbi:hypothetical protein AAULR_08316 [Lacticaseibacillus rhamnosus MTCC 5462]|nr:hypothetical protein AAULR_08316 [Lacticaseibacillus rhamnosus MTCC 5462]